MKFFSEFFASFAVQSNGHFGMKFFFAEVLFALIVAAQQARKLRPKLRHKLQPGLPPSKTQTSPKTSLCRKPFPEVLGGSDGFGWGTPDELQESFGARNRKKKISPKKSPGAGGRWAQEVSKIVQNEHFETFSRLF